MKHARLAIVPFLVLVSCGSPTAPIVSTPTAVMPAGTGPLAPPPSVPPVAAPSKVEPDVPSGADATRDAELTIEAANIFDAFVNTLGSLTPDGKKVLFRSNRDGIPQLYLADASKPDSAATRILQTKERIADGRVMQDGKTLVFRSDKGADENFSIFKVGLDGQGLVELTPGETLHRDELILADGVPDTVFYSARAMKEKAARIYRQSTTPGTPPKLLYTDPQSSFLVDVSRDGKSALLLRLASLSDSKLVLVDLVAGTAKTIHPAEGKTAFIRQASFSPDASRIYLSTDGGGEEAILLSLDAKSLAETARYVEKKPATANIDEFVVAKKGDRIAVRIDAGNRSELRILDANTLKPTSPVTMPLGTGGGLSVSDDGTTIVVHWSTPSSPFDLFAIDIKSGKSRALRKESRPTLAKMPPLEASITEVASFDGTKIPVNLYLPKPMPKKKMPTMVIVHGGPASSYAIRWSSFNRFFSAHGFAIVEPNIRGSTGFGRAYEKADDGPKRLDAVKDAEAIGKWAASQTWADADRLVLLGGSYGGYMTLMGVTRHPTLWKAGVDIFGIYSWRTFMKTTGGVIRDIFQIEIGPESDGAFLDSISPASAIDQVKAPLFVYAGANDPRVPLAESDQIVASLRARKIPVEYMVAANEGHSLDRKDNVTSFLARTQRFLENHLKIGK